MIAKTFEIRDDGTFIPILAVKLEPGTEQDRYLLARAGYGTTPQGQAGYIQLVEINGGSGESHCDNFKWSSRRTMHIAHKHIKENFDSLESGAVVDVAFILGETRTPKASEREETGAFW